MEVTNTFFNTRNVVFDRWNARIARKQSKKLKKLKKKKEKKQEYKTRKKIVVRMQACVLFTLYLLSIAMLRIKIESPNAVYHRYALNIQRLKREKDPENSCVDVWRSVNRVLSSCMRWKTCKKRELGSRWTTILGCPSEMTGVLDMKFDDNGTILKIIVLAQ